MVGGNLGTADPSRAATLLSRGIVLTLPSTTAWIWAVSAIAATVLALAWWRGTYGGSIGHTVIRLRSVDSTTGLQGRVCPVEFVGPVAAG
ncbi:hypothetical protein [Microbacterium sp.]|uniref:hypothetical protein n=1 Tax=Microbacterium sp. TaxID=51671 RepID=UPI003A8B548E